MTSLDISTAKSRAIGLVAQSIGGGGGNGGSASGYDAGVGYARGCFTSVVPGRRRQWRRRSTVT